MLAQFRTSATEPDRDASTARRLRSDRSWERGEEPPLAELMDDPVMHRLLAGDNIDPAALWALLRDVRQRLSARG